MKMFWYTSLMNILLSSSEYPAPWIIRICLMKVDLPDSPVPRRRSLSSRLASLLSFLNCLSISAFILFCSFCSSLRQHAILFLHSANCCLWVVLAYVLGLSLALHNDTHSPDSKQ